MRSTIGLRRIGGWLYYVIVICFGAFLCCLALLSFSFEAPPIIFLCMGLVFCAIGILGFVWEKRFIFPVVLDGEKIALGKRGTFYWRDLEQADLQARWRGSGNNHRKAIMLKFRNEEPIYLLNYGYGNIGDMRTYITGIIAEKIK